MCCAGLSCWQATDGPLLAHWGSRALDLIAQPISPCNVQPLPNWSTSKWGPGRKLRPLQKTPLQPCRRPAPVGKTQEEQSQEEAAAAAAGRLAPWPGFLCASVGQPDTSRPQTLASVSAWHVPDEA